VETILVNDNDSAGGLLHANFVLRLQETAVHGAQLGKPSRSVVVGQRNFNGTWRIRRLAEPQKF
jgi:hypothetical protein